MPRTIDELLDDALSLPEPDRAELAEMLVASLTSDPTRIHPAWADELRRRSAEFDAGSVECVPWEDVRREAEAVLDDTSPPDG